MRTKKYVSHANKNYQTIMENFRRFAREKTTEHQTFKRDSQLLIFEGKKVVGSTSLLEEINKVETIKEWNQLYRRWEKSVHCVWGDRNKILKEGLVSFLKGAAATVKEFAKDPVGELGRQLYMLGQKAMAMGRKAVKGGLIKKLIGGVEKLLAMKRKFAKKYPKINKTLGMVAAVVTVMAAFALFYADAQAADLIRNTTDFDDAGNIVKELIASQEQQERLLDLMQQKAEHFKSAGGYSDEQWDSMVDIMKKNVDLKGELNLSDVTSPTTKDPQSLNARRWLNFQDDYTKKYTSSMNYDAQELEKFVKRGVEYLDKVDAKELAQGAADAGGGDINAGLEGIDLDSTDPNDPNWRKKQALKKAMAAYEKNPASPKAGRNLLKARQALGLDSLSFIKQ